MKPLLLVQVKQQSHGNLDLGFLTLPAVGFGRYPIVYK